METFYPYIGGEFVKTSSVKSILCPYDGTEVGKVGFAGVDLVKKALEYAQQGFERMKSLSTYDRAKILEDISNLITQHKEEISKILALEAGKPIHFARGEVSRCALTFKTASEEAKRINGEIMDLDWATSSLGRRGYVRRFPLGVIFGITPFNFPLNLVAHKVAPALASGNSIIIKPASKDPISALWLAKIAQKAGVPKGALQVIPASSKDVSMLIEDDKVIKMITFTGSAQVGWYLKTKAGKKKVALELGGNAGVIVDKDANLEYAKKRILMGGFAYSGQVCISVQRVFIHKDVYHQMVDSLLQGIEEEVVLSHPLDEKATLSSMISEEEAIRIENWVKEAEKEGAKILTGGTRKGSIFYPTIIEGAKEYMKVYKDEVFAPVITVEPFEDFEEAIYKVNNSRYGLQAGVFTNNLSNALKAFEEIEVGGVMINDVPTFRIDPMPYGGIKDSGFGREGLKYAIEEMTEMKLMVINNRPL